MAYFLKLVGLSDDPLPEMWWEERPEIVTAIFFSEEPKAINFGDHLIYYAVGGSKRIVAEAEVNSEATETFPPQADWPAERRAKFKWRMAVKLISKCANNDDAPLITDFYTKQVRSSYISLTEDQGERMAKAIKSCGHR